MKNLKGELVRLKYENIKPNYSELSRIYKKDRRTIKKIFQQIGNEDESQKRNKRVSKLSKYDDLIVTKLNIPGSNRKAVYMYIITEVDCDIGSYSNFRKYVNNHLKDRIEKDETIHLRFETEYGQQLQFDWKGPITLHTKFGEEISFYIFASTLGASRYHVYIYSQFMTAETVNRCLIETFQRINGVPKECLTDNMSSIVNYSEKAFTKEFKAFAKDMNFIPKKCKKSSPETKGKDESCNRFMSWLYPYDYEFDTEEKLIEIIKKINTLINNEINSTIGMTPQGLYTKEKEYLQPLPNKQIIEQYLDTMIPAKVSNGLLVYYKGKQYSVPPKYINQTVKLNELDNKLYIYYNKELIAMHDISENKINYQEEHYKKALEKVMPYKTSEQIEALAEKNLKLFGQLSK